MALSLIQGGRAGKALAPGEEGRRSQRGPPTKRPHAARTRHGDGASASAGPHARSWRETPRRPSEGERPAGVWAMQGTRQLPGGRKHTDSCKAFSLTRRTYVEFTRLTHRYHPTRESRWDRICTGQDLISYSGRSPRGARGRAVLNPILSRWKGKHVTCRAGAALSRH